tara:strand:- start:818 stop:1495 length:678 start_codon:yes stop_codon:yes gene_type:complete
MGSTSSEGTIDVPESAAPAPRPAARKKRRLDSEDIEKVLRLHFRAPRLPILDDTVRDLDLFHEATLPHAVRDGVRLVESRRVVQFTLQLKTYDRARNSVALLGEDVLRYATMKLALVPSSSPSNTYVSSRHTGRPPEMLRTKQASLFTGRTDVTGSFALGTIDAHGYCAFSFKILLRTKHVADAAAKDLFCLAATPLDPGLQCEQLSWRSAPFSVKVQIRSLTDS